MKPDSPRHTWAIVPARSGSRGFKDKNVAPLLGVPLFAHSVAFAKKLSFVDRVVVSTDSEAYATLARTHGAEVPFLRGAAAAADDSMEEDVLEDIRLACEREGVKPPTDIVWLRPTHPLREVAAFEEAWRLHKETGDGVCVVVREDPRVFFEDGAGRLVPVVDRFADRSMVRRQDCPPSFRIFGGEVFSFPTRYDRLFLGASPRYVVAPDGCTFDIDDAYDLQRLESFVSHPEKGSRYAGLVHGA